MEVLESVVGILVVLCFLCPYIPLIVIWVIAVACCESDEDRIRRIIREETNKK